MSSPEQTLFEVTASGVIVLPGIPEPQIRSDVFERVDPSDVHTSDDLISLIDSCQPLAEHFRDLSMQYLQEHTQASSFAQSLVAQRGGLTGTQQLIVRALRRNPEEGWRQWIEYSGDAALEEFLELVRDWLAEDVDWDESEHFDAVWNGQAAALAYFDDLPSAALKALGVRIVDGDVPGSNYRAAELCKDLDQANQNAQRLELQCRFQAKACADWEFSHD